MSAEPPKGLSIHIGLNAVDPAHYKDQEGKPWPGHLTACEFDANDMEAVAKSQGFETKTLLTADATTSNVSNAIADFGERLGPEDVLCITYSGHGGQVPDANGDEDDRLDETWALYDRQLVDDELYAMWSKLTPGARVLVLSDSCHSGSVLKLMPSQADLEKVEQPAGDEAAPGAVKALPPEVEDAVYQEHKELYDRIQRDTPDSTKAHLSASALLISGCKDNQTSGDGDRNGVFTGALRQVWNEGQFRGGYRDFCAAIDNLIPDGQDPNLMTAGEPNPAFEAQEPFTI
jgi:metacaspase-1